METSELSGLRALVTGASKRIGKAIAHLLAAEGAHVALVARPSDALSEAAKEIASAAGDAHAVPADLSTREGCAMAAEGGATHGRGVEAADHKS